MFAYCSQAVFMASDNKLCKQVVARHMDNIITRKQKQLRSECFPKRKYVLEKCKHKQHRRNLPTNVNLKKQMPKLKYNSV